MPIVYPVFVARDPTVMSAALYIFDMCIGCLTEAGRDLAVELIDQTLGFRKEDLPLEDEFRLLILDAWRQAVNRGTQTALEFLEAASPILNAAETEELLRILGAGTREVLTTVQTEQASALFLKGYEKGKVAGFGMPGISFKLLDEMAVHWLTDHHLWWIGQYYDRFLSASIAERVREGVAAGFGRVEIGNTLRDFFVDYPGISYKPDFYWRGLAGNAMNRSRNMGKVGGFVDAGTQNVRISAVMDERTSKICQKMNGTIVSVDTCNSQRLKMIQAIEPASIKAIAPWPRWSEIKDMTAEEILQEKGIAVPPYHFLCRTTLIIEN